MITTSLILTILSIVVLIAVLIWLLSAYFQLMHLANKVEQKRTAVAAVARRRHGLADQMKTLTHQKVGGDADVLLEKDDKRLCVQDIVVIETDTNNSVTAGEKLAAQDDQIGSSPEYRDLLEQIKGSIAEMVGNREDYDDNARTYNIVRSMVLRRSVAHLFGFQEAPYFPIDVLTRTLPDQTPLPLA